MEMDASGITHADEIKPRSQLTMTQETTERFMSTLQQIEATGDVEPLVAMFTEDAELSKLAHIEQLHGRDGARRFWRNYLQVFDRIHSTFTHVVEGDNSAVLEWTAEGALTTGEPLHYQGISVIEFTHGLVHRFRTYYDSAVFLPQGAK
jgi:ketosteroid isomerase-like protein